MMLLEGIDDMKKTNDKSKRTTAASHSDANIVMRLYDLRREPEMRKAREYMVGQFWPTNFEEYRAVAESFGTDHNRYLRQVLSFWDMATALVLRGAVHPGLFNDWGGEMYFLFAKLQPVIKEVRAKSGNPNFWMNVEKVCTMSDESRAKLDGGACHFQVSGVTHDGLLHSPTVTFPLVLAALDDVADTTCPAGGVYKL